MDEYRKIYNENVEKAKLGNCEAQNVVGVCCIKMNQPKEAFEWFTKSAKGGSSGAFVNLANCYFEGIGVSADTQAALKILFDAAKKGGPEAQFVIAKLYSAGKYLAKDQETSTYWLRQAATNGHQKAQATLGGMYYSGAGVEKDAAQAIHWFTLAANQGNPVAQYDLGRIYLFDEQVKNIETGINWIEKSASLGYPKAIELR